MKLTPRRRGNVQQVVVGKLLDRFGKGIRAPHGCAHRGFIAAPETFVDVRFAPIDDDGLRRRGGLASPPWTVMKATHNNFRATFTLATFPSIIAIFILIKAVRKPKRKMSKPKYKPLMLPGRGRAFRRGSDTRGDRWLCLTCGRDGAEPRARPTCARSCGTGDKRLGEPCETGCGR